MKKLSLGFFSLFIFANLAFCATNNPRGVQIQKKISKNFTSGTVANGTLATGKARRWYFFNEGLVGSSYTFLGKSQYVSVDLGYSFYIRSIESVFGGMNFMIGSEFSVPLYIKPVSNSRSNILNDHRHLEKHNEGLAGVGVELPLMIGLEYKGFYVVGLAGYTWLFMKDTYQPTQMGDYPTIKTQYDGVIYGGGLGYKISNILNIGIRYTGGSIANRGGSRTQLNAQANQLNTQLITQQTGRSIYNIPYHRIHIFVSLIF